ncbi:MAG: ABC transporter ATP-binding protein [Hydrotalea sp.]|nr:ABC transporter ATP-binding protein [Hydrotalea sp.]
MTDVFFPVIDSQQGPENAIDISGLCKSYKKRKGAPEVTALDNVSLKIKRGSISALLGPNGAGKSTLINILGGLTMKTSGSVKIWGIDIDKDARNARAAIGIVPQELNIDPFFVPDELLELQAGLYGIKKKDRHTMEILDMVGLKDKAKTYARNLSGGMRRRLLVAKAMVHNPPILVLDEPTAGVDIDLRRQLWDNVRALNKNGVTILLTTHYLEEAEELCDDIAIIDKGKLLVHEKKDILLKKLDAKSLQFVLSAPLPAEAAILQQFSCQQTATDDGFLLKVSYKPSDHSAGEIVDIIKNQQQVVIKDITSQESDLEDIFLQLTRKVPPPSSPDQPQA